MSKAYKHLVKRGFTLIELLLAVVVLTILATLLLAVFAGAQEKARRATLQNDLKLYSTAQALYHSEHDGFADGPTNLPGYALSEGVSELSHKTESGRWRLVLGHSDSEWRCAMQGGAGATGVEAKAPVCVKGDDFDFYVSDQSPPAEEPVTFDATDAIARLAFGGEVDHLMAALAADREDIETVAWLYGDGTPVDQGAPETHTVRTHTYLVPGSYAATLALTKTDGSVVTGQKTIAVGAPLNSAPTAAFSYSQRGFEVSFDAAGSVDVNGDVLTYHWDFGDGSEDEKVGMAEAQHTYAATGDYTVTLTVTDPKGKSQSLPLTVHVDALPAASFSFSPENPEAGDSVHFDASASSDPEGATLSYAWDFGWTGSAAGVTAGVEIPEGEHSVRLIVTDAVGQADTLDQTVVVRPAGAPLIVEPLPDHTGAPEESFTGSVTVKNTSAFERNIRLELTGGTLALQGFNWAQNGAKSLDVVMAAGEERSFDALLLFRKYKTAGTQSQVTVHATNLDAGASATSSATSTFTVAEQDGEVRAFWVGPTEFSPGDSGQVQIKLQNNANFERLLSFELTTSSTNLQLSGADSIVVGGRGEAVALVDFSVADSALANDTTRVSISVFDAEEPENVLFSTVLVDIGTGEVLQAPSISGSHSDHPVLPGEEEAQTLTITNNSNAPRTLTLAFDSIGSNGIAGSDPADQDIALGPFETRTIVVGPEVSDLAPTGASGVYEWQVWDKDNSALGASYAHTLTVN